MSYATLADLEERYTADLIVTIADNNGDGQPDEQVVSRALVDADGIINSYLSVRYSLPLTQVPQVIIAAAVDIAVYRMAMTADRLTTEMRVRFEDAMTWLKHISEGKAGLGIPDPTPDDDTDNAEKPGRAYSFKSVRSS